MSLLDCICCPQHKHRTAVCWDDLKCPLVLTYSELLARTCAIACYLRRNALLHNRQAVVGLYGNSCPQILAAMLGILALPAAYLPVDLSQTTFMEVLREHGVDTLLVHLPFFESFLSRLPSSCIVEFDIGLLEHGLVIALLKWKDKLQTKNGSHAIHRTTGRVTVHECSSVSLCHCCKNALPKQQDGIPTNIFALYHKEVAEYLSISSNSLEPECSPNPASNLANSTCTSTNVEQTCSLKLLEFELRSSLKQWSFPVVSPSSLAYVLHTSGTTGRPKPVKVPHCSIVPNIVDLKKRFSMCSDDVVFNAAPLTFDPSVVEIFLALSSGASLLIVPESVKRSPSSLASVLFHRQCATVLQITPALAYQLAGSETDRLLGPRSCVRVLAFGGEDCPSLSLLQKWKHHGNETLVFNLYGITEVSSWATCQHIPLVPSSSGAAPDSRSGRQVPLGKELLGTVIELRDDDGTKLKHGFGEIWIGGDYRVCLLGGEEQLAWGCMRPSGDYGYLDCGNLFFEGRCDDQIKRAGHRISLSSIQQEMLTFENVSACALTTTSKDKFNTSPLREHLNLTTHSLLGVTDLLLAFVVPNRPAPDTEASGNLQSYLSLQSTLRKALPSHSIPDELIFVKTLPTTEHGKVDLKSLVDCAFPAIYLPIRHTTTDEATSIQSTHLFPIDSSAITSILTDIASQFLGIKGWKECLLDHGASSFDVVLLANRFEQELESKLQLKWLNLSLLVDHLLSKPLDEVVHYVCGSKTTSETVTSRKRNRVKNEGYEEFPAYKKLLSTSIDNAMIHAWRRGKHFVNGMLQRNNFDLLQSAAPSCSLRCGFTIKWKVGTGKCVDASPLLVAGDDGQPPVVYVGSHSGLLFAIGARSGEVKWSTQLSDRIESSACLSVCGQYVVVGCYDGCVYTVSTEVGEVHWCFQTGSEPVKSSPCVDPITGLVWFGSHDHKLYAIDITMKTMVHCLHLGGGACFSSPCLDSATRLLYCATLQGVLSAVNADTGDVVWTFQCPKPIFSTPALLLDGSVVVGCVDGLVYVIGNNGTLNTVLTTEKPVFSSCCIVTCTTNWECTGSTSRDTRDELEANTKIYCGSHDKYVHCWNGKWGLEWRTQLASAIYSIPCHCTLKLNPESDYSDSLMASKETVEVLCVCVCSTNGLVYVLSAQSGDIIGRFQLPGHVFSSPISIDNTIVIGCRDDNVYCLEVHTE